MRKLTTAVCLVCIVTTTAEAASGRVAPSQTEQPKPAREGDSAVRWAEGLAERIQSLTLQQRVAQLMLVTLQGSPTPDSSDRTLLKSCPVGGVILPSLMRPKATADYVVALRQMSIEPATGVPLFIGADLYELPKHGWGPRDFFPPFPSLLTLAAADTPQATQDLANLMGEFLKTLGLNLCLGPPLTLAPTLPGVPGHIHCLGSDPEVVAQAGCTIVKTLEGRGLVTAAMGFPGGCMNRRPKGPAVLLTPREGVREQDLLPYRRAIEAGAPVIHVANTLVPTLDPLNVPASVSSVVMTDLLRDELGFQGIILAGPMDAPEITQAFDASEAAQEALRAGADMILWNSAGQRVLKTVDEIARNIERGELSQEVVDAAVARVWLVKDRYGLKSRELPKARDTLKLEKRKRHTQAAYQIERRAITLVQNQNQTLPLTQASSLPVGVTGVVGVNELHRALKGYLKNVAKQPIATARHAGAIYDFEIDRVTRYIRGARTIVCVLTPDVKPAGQTELIQAIKLSGPRVVVVLVGYPETLPALALADAIVLTYCDATAIDAGMQAVADALVGRGSIGFFKPENEPQLKVGEPQRFSLHGIVRVPGGTLPVDVKPPYMAGLGLSYDPSYAVKKILWQFGDGTRSKDAVVEKAYTAPGRFPVVLTVTDTKGQVSTHTFHTVVSD